MPGIFAQVGESDHSGVLDSVVEKHLHISETNENQSTVKMCGPQSKPYPRCCYLQVTSLQIFIPSEFSRASFSHNFHFEPGFSSLSAKSQTKHLLTDTISVNLLRVSFEHSRGSSRKEQCFWINCSYFRRRSITMTCCVQVLT